jgi:hypothetical protein
MKYGTIQYPVLVTSTTILTFLGSIFILIFIIHTKNYLQNRNDKLFTSIIILLFIYFISQGLSHFWVGLEKVSFVDGLGMFSYSILSLQMIVLLVGYCRVANIFKNLKIPSYFLFYSLIIPYTYTWITAIYKYFNKFLELGIEDFYATVPFVGICYNITSSFVLLPLIPAISLFYNIKKEGRIKKQKESGKYEGSEEKERTMLYFLSNLEHVFGKLPFRIFESSIENYNKRYNTKVALTEYYSITGIGNKWARFFDFILKEFSKAVGLENVRYAISPEKKDLLRSFRRIEKERFS